MNLRAIVYASEAIPGLSNGRIHDLAQSACRFNLQAGVTGVLLYDGRRFFHYLEGPEDGMAIVYARVLAARIRTSTTTARPGCPLMLEIA
ncbi:BLUF domain-containing protein [uncultured Stenotrophomonas sp.]|uniref:BLUF domain-containing protein n=1 Tax=uncultured Stenotrophomonas sp. TaxID=165438 RepID=UPI0025D21DD8|nr:BLUF domain-containing protein [uncultured Stenotrophomonas sp.]